MFIRHMEIHINCPALSRGLQKLNDTHKCTHARKSLVKGERFSRSNARVPEIVCMYIFVISFDSHVVPSVRRGGQR